MKQCTKCGETKNLSLFGINKTYKDGFTNQCKRCMYVAQEQHRKSKTTLCSVKTCDRKVRHRGLCSAHYQRLRTLGDIQENIPLRQRRSNGKGKLTSNGYILQIVPDHPNARSDGRILEHTWVMSNYLGRPLKKGENVHHKNGNRADNRIDNLELWSTNQPSGQRIEDKIVWAIELIQEYIPEILCLPDNFDTTSWKPEI